MAEVNSLQAANAAAGTKNRAADHNRLRALVVTMAASWTAANGDTAATKQMLPPNCRVVQADVACAAGAASSTLSVGLRDAKDGANPDADALVNAQSIATAANVRNVSGALMLNGADGLTPDRESEVFLTFGGANPTANQDLRVTIWYIAP